MATATKDRLATISGVFLAPGVSKNGRLYTSEAIGKAVTRMKSQIADEAAPPVAMLTSHGDSSVLNTVGRIVDAWQTEDGKGHFKASVPNTSAGRDLAELADQKYVRNVSINGNWVGDPWIEDHDGQECETGDDLSVPRVDFVPTPGVTAAAIDGVVFEGVPEGGFWDVFEDQPTVEDFDWVEATAVEADSAPYGNVSYADPGYQADKKKRYPVDTAGHARSAWAYINKAKNAAKYTADQVTLIKGKIKAAAKKFGIKIAVATQQSALQGSLLEGVEAQGGSETGVGQPAPMHEHGDGLGTAKGPFPGAVRLDHDSDGDIDGWACPNCGHMVANTDSETNPDANTDQFDWGSESSPRHTTKEAATVTDTPAAHAATTEGNGLPTTKEALDALVAESVQKALAEAAKPKLPQTQEELDALVQSRIDEAVAKSGRPLPPRKGIDTQTARENRETRPLHEMSSDELHEALKGYATNLPLAPAAQMQANATAAAVVAAMGDRS